MKILFDDEELQDEFPGGEDADEKSDADFDHDYMTNKGINDDPDIDDADDDFLDNIDDDLLNEYEDPYDDDEDDAAIEAEKDEVGGQANDLIGQPSEDDEDE